MTPADLLAHLDQLPAASPPGLALLLEFEDRVERFEQADDETLVELVGRQDEIAKAIADLEAYTSQVQELIQRCSRLSPVASTHPPIGF